MLSNIGAPGVILILVVALIVFGPDKLPEIGRAAGKSIKEFKRASQGLTDNIMEEFKGEPENKEKVNKKS